MANQVQCPNDGTEMVEGSQIGGGMTFAYIASPQEGGTQTIWLHTRVCPTCGLVQTYIREPELFRPKW